MKGVTSEVSRLCSDACACAKPSLHVARPSNCHRLLYMSSMPKSLLLLHLFPCPPQEEQQQELLDKISKGEFTLR